MVAAKSVSASRVQLARMMSPLEANHLGDVHGGVVMREVDVAGGIAAARHCGITVVTASIDELSFLAPVHVGDILHLLASVNAVGETSIEVGVRVEAEDWRGGDRRHTTSAYLVYVALADGGRPAPVPALVAETADDRRRQAQAQIRRQVRKERIKRLGSWRPEPAHRGGQAAVEG